MRATVSTAAFAILLLSSIAQGQGAPPRTLADSLEAARRQRLALEAALERQTASGIAERAKTLSMSSDANALQRLETLLDSAHARLLVQRDRIRALKDAAALSEKAILVVMIRADAAPDGELVASILLDGVQQKTVTITPERGRAMASGASEEIFRGEATPVEHKLVVSVAARGLQAVETVTLPMAARELRYVELVIRGGKLVPTTWTSRTGSP